MPEDPRPDAPRPAENPTPGPAAGSGAPTPDEAELARVAVPATVRRAPRYRAFLVAGALLGALVGLVVAVATAAGSGLSAEDDGGVLPFLGGQNGVRAVLAVSGAFVGLVVGGVLALLADRRSTRRRRPAPPA